MIHVGMAGGRDFYSVERRGHRDGYMMTDVDGVVLGDEKEQYKGGKDKEGREWVWEGCPVELETGCDIDDVWKRWRGVLSVSFFSLCGVMMLRLTDAGRRRAALRRRRTISLRFHLLFQPRRTLETGRREESGIPPCTG
jgi:hypothetical protein